MSFIKKLYNAILLIGLWTKEERKFCPFCNSTYDTLEDAKFACEQDENCRVVYDLFCDDIGYFCICPIDSIVTQFHPRGNDCVYWKEESTLFLAK